MLLTPHSLHSLDSFTYDADHSSLGLLVSKCYFLLLERARWKKGKTEEFLRKVYKSKCEAGSNKE